MKYNVTFTIETLTDTPLTQDQATDICYEMAVMAQEAFPAYIKSITLPDSMKVIS